MWHWKQRTEMSTCKPRQNKNNQQYFFILLIIFYMYSLMCIFYYKQYCRNVAIIQWTFTDHLIVLFRLGWLTVLSSMNIVEQELYFFESRPGETFGKDQHLILAARRSNRISKAQPQNRVRSTFTHVVYVIAFPPIPYWKRENQGFFC